LKTKNLSLFLLMAILWGSSWSLTKKGLEFVPPLNFASQQFLISTMVLMPFLVTMRDRLPRDARVLGRLVIFSLLNALSIAMVNLGLMHESSGIGAVLVFTQPLMVFGISVVLLHEKARSLRLIGVLTGLAGTTTISLKEGAGLIPAFSYATLLLILGAFAWALAAVYYKKYLNNLDVIVATTLQFAVGFVVLLAFSMASEGFVFPLVSQYLGILLYVSLGSSILGTVIWLYLLGREDATTLSSYGFMVPIIALIFGWWLLGESITGRYYLGTILIISGIYLVQKQ
jgi:O-acetylserine/cysteine efflux transporter